MPTPTRQLLASTFHLTDGTTTIWNFSFSGGYIDKGHIKAYYETPAGIRTILTVTEAMVVGAYQLQIAPVIASGNTLVIYRDTPKTAPLVDFTDESGLSEIALDTTAKQAVFIGAEAFDNSSATLEAQLAASDSEASAVQSAYYAQQASDYATASSLSAEDSALSAIVAESNALNSAGGFRNRIINGGMQVAQRGAVAAINNATNYGGADRTLIAPLAFTTLSSGNVVQSSLTGSSTGYGQWLSGTTTTGSGTIVFQQRIESANCFGLNSKTVTFSGLLYQDTGAAITSTVSINKATVKDNFGAVTQMGSTSVVTLPSAVLTPFSLTVTLGATDANNGLAVAVSHAVGAVTSKNFAVGDLQLELGSVATPFEQRPYGMELALCQRYYEVAGYVLSTTATLGAYSWKAEKRATPTLTLTPGSGTGGTISVGIAVNQRVGFYQNTAHSVASYSDVTASAEL